MAPVVAMKTSVDRGNNFKADPKNGNSSGSGASHRTCSKSGSQPTQLRASSSKDDSRALTSTIMCNQKQTIPSKRTLTPSSVMSPAVPSRIEIKSTSAFPMPSTRLHKYKQASVFTSGKQKHKTNFSSAYDSGSIPCRINHGSIHNSLLWTKDPNTLTYDPLLITCVEGFAETQHPFVFLARATFRELMKLENARDKTLPILAKVVVPLRGALMAKDDDTFLMALEATRLLSNLVEGEMNGYLSRFTQQIHRKLLTKQLRAEVEETLAVLESNGGKEALAIIRSKIPTYASVR